MEPNLSDQTEAVLYAPTAGIVCPFLLNIAMAENACTNGVEFRFNTKVTGFTRTEEGWLVHTDKGDVETRIVVNAAGVYADELHNMVCEEKIHITPRRGDYCLLDKSAGDPCEPHDLCPAGEIRKRRSGVAHGPWEPHCRSHGH